MFFVDVCFVQLPATISSVNVEATGHGTALVQVTLHRCFDDEYQLIHLPSSVAL